MATNRATAGLYVLSLGALLAGGGPAEGAEAVRLRESSRPGQVTQGVVALKAEGQFRPGAEPGGGEKEKSEGKPLALKVATTLAFFERTLAAGPDGRPSRVARRVVEAASTIGGQVRPASARLRPEVALLVAERRDGGIVVYSPGGPLTRAELELVEGAGDPLALADLLPERPVAVGDHWTVGAPAARSLSGYDALAANRLEATLEALDEGEARVRLKGEVRGAALGGEGTIGCEGQFTFDRKAARVARLELRRKESRKPGPVEAGLDVASTLTVERREAEPPAELTDAAVAALPAGPQPGLELLLLTAPDGKYTLLHDRDWHTYWDDARLTILKRLDHGEVVAQCNLSTGPNAGRGRHQDPKQFREDIRNALGRRFGEVLSAAEVGGDPAGGYRYRVEVRGREGDVEILWDYYLVAGPEGDQVLATFTRTLAQAKAFGDQDLQLMGTLRWQGATPPAGAR
jgi:hypothetical protein